MLVAMPGRGGLCSTVPVPSRVLYLLDTCQGLRFWGGGHILGLQTLSTGSQKFLNRDPLGAQACPAYSRLTWLSCLRSWQADPQDAEWAVSLNVCASLAGQAPVVQDSGSSHLS